MKLTICGADISEFGIVLPQNPEPAEQRAAEFLQRVLKASCGVTPSVTEEPSAHNIRIGTLPHSDELRWDGYRIKTDDSDLFLCGNIARGTLYAAYGFAERYLGYRSFTPDTEVIPTEGSAEVPSGFSVVDNPLFELRRNDWIGHTKYPDFASRARLCTYSDGEKYGGNITSLGGCHTMESLLPPDKYFDEHPEYYSLWEGKRIPGSNSFNIISGQPCLSHPDVLRIVTDNVLDKLRKNPGARMIDVSQNDNSRYCQCERCAAIDAEEGSPSGTLIRFVNSVAEAVEKEFPDVLVQTFAYQYTRKAPKITKPRKNVIIRYCTIEACFRHPLNDPKCELNAGVFAKELTEWQQIADKLSIWDYITNYRCYVAPFPNLGVLRENARFFADCHAIHLFEEDNPGNWSGTYGDLKAYLAAKLMWDPYMSEETYQEHIDGFLKAYYGAGWQEILRYIALEHDATENVHMTCFEHADISTAFESKFPDVGEFMAGEYLPKAYQPVYPDSYLKGLIERLDEATALWDKAYEMAESEQQKMHVARSRMALTYLELFCVPHDPKKMSDEERASYEAAVEKYCADKEAYGFHYNLWTARFHNR